MSKLPAVGTTIFTVMSKLAAEHGAYNLSQGFPNFPVDELLLQLVEEKTRESIHQYMPMAGFPPLLIEIAALVERAYSRRVVPEDELLVTAGATQGLFTSIMAFIDRGDEVLILDPSYDSYAPAVILAGGTPIHIPLKPDFLPDWDRIAQAITAKTRMLITNNPHNPSGRVWAESDMDNLRDLMLRHAQILWLSDEVYEFITFGQKHYSAHQEDALRERSIVISSFGKTFHITGWKIGYVVAPKALMQEIKKIHQFNVFCVNSPAQAALSAYLPMKDVGALGAFYQEKRDLFQQLLEASRFELLPCEGTYFQTASYRGISELDDVAFCHELTTKHKVAAIPISVFNADKRDDKIIRFCFAKDNETLIQATTQLCKI